jgi:cathepsin L
MKFAAVLVFFAFFALATAHMTWEEFKNAHNKRYTAFEERVRRAIFYQNVAKIERQNWVNKNFQLAVNKFADLTFDEFSSFYNGYRHSQKFTSNSKHNVTLGDLPTAVDWREKNVVAPVKDQAQCGSCWAFSAVASLESAHALATKKLVELSEQQLVDCSQAEGNQGCNGGLMDQAFDYIKKFGGLDTEASYPYTGQDGKCHATTKDVGATLKSWVDIPANDEKALQDAVASKGPVSVAIDATFFLQFYNGGIFNDPICTATSLNHGVTAVGYGSENGKDYWLVKNSWGASWGEKGYFRMLRGKNLCGIAASASYPVV